MNTAADPLGDPQINVESRQLAELQAQKDEVLLKVQSLKKELQDWRGKLENQVKTYRTELGDLKKNLNSEVEGLRSEFLQLRAALKKQLDLTAGLATQEGVPVDMQDLSLNTGLTEEKAT